MNALAAMANAIRLLLHLTGYPDMTIEEIKRFRQLGSRTAGHPSAAMLSGSKQPRGRLAKGLAVARGQAPLRPLVRGIA